MCPKNTSPNTSDQFYVRTEANERVLRLTALLAVIDISAPTLWRRVKDKSFPRPISLGGRSVGWLQSEIHAWIKARTGLRDQIHAVKSEGVHHD